MYILIDPFMECRRVQYLTSVSDHHLRQVTPLIYPSSQSPVKLWVLKYVIPLKITLLFPSSKKIVGAKY